MKFNEKGFTLIELIVAMAIGLLVMGGIYSVYYSQQKSYIAQEQVVSMQQNLRSGMILITKDIRMAGYDPTGALGAGITTALSNQFVFSYDDDDDGDLDIFTYSLADNGADGDNDLVRDINGGGNQLLAENIDAVDFVYLDSNGAVTAVLANIRSIQVTMIALTNRPDPGYVNNTTFFNQQGVEIVTNNDNNRRRVLTREIKCRNLGLGS